MRMLHRENIPQKDGTRISAKTKTATIQTDDSLRLGLLDNSDTKMNTLVDLNLLTYVIKVRDASYVSIDAEISSHDTRVVTTTDDIELAKIFNDSQIAQRIAQRLNDQFCARVLPVSKKTFFSAKLKGKRS